MVIPWESLMGTGNGRELVLYSSRCAHGIRMELPLGTRESFPSMFLKYAARYETPHKRNEMSQSMAGWVTTCWSLVAREEWRNSRRLNNLLTMRPHGMMGWKAEGTGR